MVGQADPLPPDREVCKGLGSTTKGVLIVCKQCWLSERSGMDDYQAPSIDVMGQVAELTLTAGSDVDAVSTG